ncbi:MAG: S26 family signal peptidase [archaeon]
MGLYIFDVASSVFVVLAIGAFLFAASGVWPPLVAIESGSMDPHVKQGDLVFVMEEQRFPGDGAHGETGIVSAAVGADTEYRTFDGYGDVIVYQPHGNAGATPIIHRAMFWVEEGENWYQRADSEFRGSADSCEELRNCPAPNAGFITKGDDNARYDQVMQISGPVQPEWVIGTAEVRVPLLGNVRLTAGQATGATEQTSNESTT